MTTTPQRQYLLLEVLLTREDPLVNVLLPESYHGFTILSREPGEGYPLTSVILIVDPGRTVYASDEHVLSNWKTREEGIEASVVVLSVEAEALPAPGLPASSADGLLADRECTQPRPRP